MVARRRLFPCVRREPRHASRAVLCGLGSEGDSGAQWHRSQFVRYLLASPCHMSYVEVHVAVPLQTPTGATAANFCRDDSDLACVLRAADALTAHMALSKEQWVHQALTYVKDRQRVWFNSLRNQRTLTQTLSNTWDEMHSKRHIMVRKPGVTIGRCWVGNGRFGTPPYSMGASRYITM